MSERIRIGIDFGGTKIESVALSAGGRELGRYRIPTPRNDYDASLAAIVSLVERHERDTNTDGTNASVGVGIPGTISSITGMVKNANSTWLNGRPLDRDLSVALQRPVRCANDANCLAVSEATDGAAAGAKVVFAGILGTGCGAGVALNGHVHSGLNGVGGEWGHNPLPWMREDEYPGADCYCGLRGCLETFVSGTGLENDYARATSDGVVRVRGPEIVARAAAGEDTALAAMARYEDRLARGLAAIVNVLDPDVIVLGGGMSQVERLYANVPPLVRKYVFGRECDTPIRRSVHGDASGVRGAAWLWGLNE